MLSDDLSMVPMTEDDIPAVLSLADESVGKNLYTRKDFEDEIRDENSFLSLLKNKDGCLAGYMYFYITTTRALAEKCGLDEAIFSSVSSSPICGRFQSAALKKEYRGRGLSMDLMEYSIDVLTKKGIDTGFAICWKPGGKVPMKKTLDLLSFTFLTEVKKMWWNNTSLYCPYCHGRCSCSAEIYYKKLQGGDK